MKILWNKMPGIFRGVFICVVALLILVLSISAYRILTIEGEVTVSEAIEADPASFTVALKPGEKEKKTITLHNSSSAELEVTLSISISPEGKGVSAKLKYTSVKVSGGGDKKVELTIEASNGAEPGEYKITIPLDRN